MSIGLKEIKQQIDNCIVETNLPYKKYQGKVRDVYDLGDKLLLVATDRLSAFDRAITNIPYKGMVLNKLSAWWFENTKHIIANHFLSMPAANQMLVKKCKPLAIEVIVRAYLTGTTSTSIWTLYQAGERTFFGTTLADGLSKNQQLDKIIVTPTSKAATHDEPLTLDSLKNIPGLDAKIWQYIKEKAIELFKFGQKVAAVRGLILVDTKYEFGIDDTGEVILIDECHTPDSSRYWVKETYNSRLAQQLEPESFDKEFLRLWYAENSNPYEYEHLPKAPEHLIVSLSQKYLQLYGMLVSHRQVNSFWV